VRCTPFISAFIELSILKNEGPSTNSSSSLNHWIHRRVYLFVEFGQQTAFALNVFLNLKERAVRTAGFEFVVAMAN
jgi:hypothetical protein